MTDKIEEIEKLLEWPRDVIRDAKGVDKGSLAYACYQAAEMALQALRERRTAELEKLRDIISERVLGHKYLNLYADKRAALDDRYRKHDCNFPYQCDVDEATDAILSALGQGSAPTDISPEQFAEIMNLDGPLSRGELHPKDFYLAIRALENISPTSKEQG